jgi:hypothetical protein
VVIKAPAPRDVFERRVVEGELGDQPLPPPVLLLEGLEAPTLGTAVNTGRWTIPGLALLAIVGDVTSVGAADAPDAWRVLSRVSGLDGALPAGTSVTRSATARVTWHATYTPTFGAEARPEDEFVVSETLNRAMRGGAHLGLLARRESPGAHTPPRCVA